jgi:hypothetical protein
VRKLSTAEVIDAQEQVLNALVRYIPEFRKTRDGDMQREIQLCCESIYIMAEQLLANEQWALGADTPTPPPARQAKRGF